MTNPANSDVQNLLPVQAYFSVDGTFQTFIGQGKPFYATPNPDQSGLHITNSTIDSSVIGGITPAAATFTSIATTTGTITTAPSGPNDIVNKYYVDLLATGLAWKQPVICATTPSGGNITLSGLQTIDTVTVTAGQRVLVKNQTNQAENGIYLASASAWTRALDANTWDELVGAIVFILEGGQMDTAWYSTTQAGGTLGVTPIVWGNFTISAIYTAGTGLQLVGTEFSIANTSVVAGSYGAASKTLLATVNAQGQLTGLSAQDISIAGSQVTGNISGNAANVTGIVAVLNGGTGASTATNARTNLGAAASGANSDITSMSGITGSISTVNTIGFNTSYSTALTAGQLGWDGNNTLAIGMAGGNVTQHIGEDQYFYYKATSAVTKGQVVMFTGAVGASGVPTGAPATGITDGTYIMGIAAENVSLNGFGLVQTFGTLRNINTSGYADGDILWYNPAVTGGLTKTKPSAPNIKVQMAAVINGGSAGGGTILIRINAGSVLGGTDSNVQFGTLANGDLIQYNGTYWENVAASSISAGSTTFSVTFNNGGSGDVSGTTFNGSSAKTISYNTIGAPKADGTGATGTWSISISGNAATATKATNIAGGATGSLPYNNGADATSFLALGTTNYVLTAGASAPQYVAQSTLSVGTATNATNIAITDDTTTNSDLYPVFVGASTGNNGAKTSSTKLKYNPSTGNLTATLFTGSWAGLPSGTALVFAQTAAPTGWTKVTSNNDAALRVVSGTASTGGSVGFTTAFASQAVSGTVGATTLTSSQIPSHTHNYSNNTGYVSNDHSHSTLGSAGGYDNNMWHYYGGSFAASDAANNFYLGTGGQGSNHYHAFSGTTDGGTGGAGSHTHSFSGTAINLAVKYVDVIIATKD